MTSNPGSIRQFTYSAKTEISPAGRPMANSVAYFFSNRESTTAISMSELWRTEGSYQKSKRSVPEFRLVARRHSRFLFSGSPMPKTEAKKKKEKEQRRRACCPTQEDKRVRLWLFDARNQRNKASRARLQIEELAVASFW